MRAWRRWAWLRLGALAPRPGHLLAGLLGEALIAGSGLLVVGALFVRTGSVGGFDPAVVLIAWGLAQAALGLARAVFAGLFVFNRRYLLDGDLDRALLRPRDPYAQVMADALDPGGLVRVALGWGAAWWGATQAGVAPGAAAAGAIATWTAGGALLVGGVLTVTASSGFWTRHEGSAVGLVSQFQGLAHVPLPVLPAPFAAAALTVVPFALTGFVPAMALLGHPGWTALAAVQPALGVVALGLGRAVFARGLRRYAA